jgi:hypothetical protein
MKNIIFNWIMEYGTWNKDFDLGKEARIDPLRPLRIPPRLCVKTNSAESAQSVLKSARKIKHVFIFLPSQSFLFVTLATLKIAKRAQFLLNF